MQTTLSKLFVISLLKHIHMRTITVPLIMKKSQISLAGQVY